MQSHQPNLFLQICSKVFNKLYFEELMIKQQQYFDIQPYKIDKLYSESAKKLYKQISFKYQNSKQLTTLPNVWHQNQRKIFIWFIVCYFYQIGVQDPTDINVNWEKLSAFFFDKTPSFLKFQFLNIIKLKKRINWTTEQDYLLTKATQEQGVGKWNQISKYIFFNSQCSIFKSPKHCRQRWLNHLDGKKNKGKWSDIEDYKIFLYVRQSGKKWSKIVQVLDNTRTQHMVKNRFNSLLSKNRKNKKQKQMETIQKIIKNLERNLCVDSQQKEKLQNKTELIEEQLQSEQQRENNIQQQKENLQSSKVKKCKIIWKKTTDQMPCFETLSTIKSYNILGKLQQGMTHIENNENEQSDWVHSEFLHPSVGFQKINGSKVAENMVVEKQCHILSVNSEQIVQSCCKKKSVYIIQKNF